MISPGVVLLVVALGLATAGAVVVLVPPRDLVPDVEARRAITGLGLLAAAIASAVAGATVLAAGDTGAPRAGVFAGAVATVALPLLAVGLTRRTRGSDRPRRSGIHR